ncbi:alkaline phosphatase PhoX [Seonamhaeicola sp.]|uniref:alkaline phosphatase PhoX n=1 Tax=Seonamhaeicola sp. TaxID=1912245 RepID=UPI002614CD01|nr:alkaline phosphatase PhoX [Seonamhaeicola sp.]
MKLSKITLLSLICCFSMISQGQNIGDFTSVTPASQTDQFVIPSSHKFQKIIETGDALTEGGTFKVKPDFTAYVPIGGSSTNGYLSVNSEGSPLTDGGGGVQILDINFNATTKLWETTASEDLNFAAFGGTAANCSGTVTSWGTVISCEEVAFNELGTGLIDFNFDGYNDVGWNIEINPATKTVLGKHWAMGNFKHENVAIHSNDRTVYQGADDTVGHGFLYKFVASSAQDLSAGDLYVFSGSKSGTGSWILINDSSDPTHQLPAHQNNTNALSLAAGATEFEGIEDVEIGPGGWIYFAVKGSPDERVYRFTDSDPLETGASTVTMETFVGGMSYDINDGSSTTSVAWGGGNDNLAFDGDGNLWVLQDDNSGSKQFYIWVVKSGHTQASPDVELFGITPHDAEPTGITFTPDYKYLFMSFMAPNATNDSNQIDAAGNSIDFNKGTTLVIALSSNLGSSLSTDDISGLETSVSPNPLDPSIQNLRVSANSINRIRLYTLQGQQLLDQSFNGLSSTDIELKNYKSGIYLLQVNDQKATKLVIE